MEVYRLFQVFHRTSPWLPHGGIPAQLPDGGSRGSVVVDGDWGHINGYIEIDSYVTYDDGVYVCTYIIIYTHVYNYIINQLLLEGKPGFSCRCLDVLV